MRRILLRLLAVTAVAAGVVASLGATGTPVWGPELVIGASLSAFGAFLWLRFRRFMERVDRAMDQFADVLGALYGPRDGNGRRAGGLVDRAGRIERKLDETAHVVERIPMIEQKVDEAATLAATSADAVRMSQRIVKEALAGLRSPAERTRKDDMDDT